MKVVLVQPEIPQNTGNIGRLCVATNTPLYLVKPLGFFLSSKQIKRSGLDYWKDLDVKLADSLEEIVDENPKSRLWYVSTKGQKEYWKVKFKKNDILVFGSESKGLPKELLETNKNQTLKIPMWGPVRSLNLATATGIVLYEAYRTVGATGIEPVASTV
ncbi:MAG: tRNA (cytidine(34)-2'-O)-methyltransferase [Deltaproteobacteria bacterium]|nr:tRNA (cytidine(34)-2'-O)-methyltransferase [Deltaproteobacteria bacterium]